MRHRNQLVSHFMIAALLTAPMTVAACAGRRGEDRYYDPVYQDYHRWDRAELGFYRQWEGETRRPHMEFGRRPHEEQRAYMDWRHRR